MLQFRFPFAALVALALIALLPTPALAQSDDERARGHFLAGSSYMDQARYDEAAAQFMEAYALSGRIEMLINASRAYERGLQHARAADVLEQLLEAEPESADRATLEARIASLRALAARAEATPAEQPDQPSEPAAVTPEPAPPIEPLAPVAREPRSRPGPVGIAGIVIGGLGVAAGVAAIATGVASQSTYDGLVEGCPGDVCPPELHGELDQGWSLATASTVLTAVGAAALATGVVLLVVDLAGEDGAPQGELAIVPSAGGALVTGRF